MTVTNGADARTTGRGWARHGQGALVERIAFGYQLSTLTVPFLRVLPLALDASMLVNQVTYVVRKGSSGLLLAADLGLLRLYVGETVRVGPSLSCSSASDSDPREGGLSRGSISPDCENQAAAASSHEVTDSASTLALFGRLRGRHRVYRDRSRVALFAQLADALFEGLPSLVTARALLTQ